MKIGRDSNGDNYHSGAYPKVIQEEINLSKKFQKSSPLRSGKLRKISISSKDDSNKNIGTITYFSVPNKRAGPNKHA